ncbi:unnamed protein product [Symbiodinium natans]|uniref:Uncharacterized protein n=1 Tax=Symbiodinium natans TaxID=878477 RepID=A0A812MCJ7_9DINO|nr:unnamed protein product [Symbiodinium natans]
MQSALNSDKEVQYMEEVRNALPEAAKLRMMPQLVQSEWSAPIRSDTDMSDEGGVCIVHKDQVPTVLRAVGYTLAPTAILTTQHTQALGLKHYPCAKVTCLLRVRDEHGDFIEVTVQRHLIQLSFGLSFGPPVTMAAEGEQILLAVPMHRAVIKMPACFGWTPEALTGASVAAILARHVPAPACEDILVRQDQSATAMIHESVLPKLLQCSGKDGVFFKTHATSSYFPEMHMLWLSEDASLDQALDLASKNDHCYGIAAKNAAHKPRFALRFLDVNEFRSAAKWLGLQDSSELGRWRLSGLPVQCGMAGALTLLESRQWQVVEILYFSEVQCVFLSKTPGNTGPMFYQQAQGRRKQLVFKALNTLARQQLADANKMPELQQPLRLRMTHLQGAPPGQLNVTGGSLRWCRRWQLVLLERQMRSPPGMRRKKSILRTSTREKHPMLRGCALTKLNNCKSHLSCLWFLPSKTRNRYMHAIQGNAARGCVRGRRAADHEAVCVADALQTMMLLSLPHATWHHRLVRDQH